MATTAADGVAETAVASDLPDGDGVHAFSTALARELSGLHDGVMMLVQEHCQMTAAAKAWPQPGHGNSSRNMLAHPSKAGSFRKQAEREPPSILLPADFPSVGRPSSPHLSESGQRHTVRASSRQLWPYNELEWLSNSDNPKVALANSLQASKSAKKIQDFEAIVAEGYWRLHKKRTRNLSKSKPSHHLSWKVVWDCFAHALVFEPFICSIVLLNVVTTGISMDVATDWLGWQIIEAIFLSIYTLELSCKLAVFGWSTFVARPALWYNVLDTSIVLVAIIDFVLQLMDQELVANGGSIVLMRLVRLVRVARIIRLFRFRVFKELMTMIAGMRSGFRALMWAFCLLIITIYPISLVLTHFLGEGDDIHGTPSPEANDQDFMMRELFTTVPRSMLTVFRCVVGDCNYSNGTPAILDLVNKYGIIWIPMYVAVKLLITFGLFNLIMAIFVDNALLDAQKQERESKLRRLKDHNLKREMIAKLLEKLLDHLIEANVLSKEAALQSAKGLEELLHLSVTRDVFNTFLQDEEVCTILTALDVPEEERLDIFEVLDANGNGTIQLEELLNGVMKLRGDPRRSDVIHVLLVLRSLQEEMQEFKDDVLSVLTASDVGGLAGRHARLSKSCSISLVSPTVQGAAITVGTPPPSSSDLLHAAVQPKIAPALPEMAATIVPDASPQLVEAQVVAQPPSPRGVEATKRKVWNV